ncbi:hypothetical protein FRC18_007690 [Serendipita sp. 400]|nr:hypothetical protein FRC18_007690 [Serendipita sp. 400]
MISDFRVGTLFVSPRTLRLSPTLKHLPRVTMNPVGAEEGFLDFKVSDEVFKTWYKVFGDLKSTQHRPLVALHGGPGAPHQSILSLVDLNTKYDVPIVLYDQIGNGNSIHLKEKPKDFWSFDLFMDELDNLLVHLGISDNYDLLGHSWGGILAAHYVAHRKPEGLKRLVLSNAPASMDLWLKRMNQLLDEMPREDQEILRKHEAAGTIDSEEYHKSMHKFHSRYTCRLTTTPVELQQAGRLLMSDPTVFEAMNGTANFTENTGKLNGWSIIEHLPMFTAKTLVINSHYDQAGDETIQPFLKLIPNVEWIKFEDSSHFPMWEERERYMEAVGKFLRF